jgi:hypothetical protein
MHPYHYRAAPHAVECQAVVPVIHPLEISVRRIEQTYPREALRGKDDRHSLVPVLARLPAYIQGLWNHCSQGLLQKTAALIRRGAKSTEGL